MDAPRIEPIVHMIQGTHRQRIFRIAMLARRQCRRHLNTAPKAPAILLFHEQISLSPVSHASGFHLCDAKAHCFLVSIETSSFCQRVGGSRSSQARNNDGSGDNHDRHRDGDGYAGTPRAEQELISC